MLKQHVLNTLRAWLGTRPKNPKDRKEARYLVKRVAPLIDGSAESAHRKFSDPLGKQRVGLLLGVTLTDILP